MDIKNLLNSAVGQGLIQNVSSQLGLNENEASTAISAAIPTILAGLTKNAQSQSGAESLNKALESKHDGGLLDNLLGAFQNNSQNLQQDGAGILGHVFGSKTSAVEQNLSTKTGISMSKIGPLLAMLAPVVMAYLGKQKRQNNTGAGGLGDLIGGVLGGAKKTSGGGIMDMVTGILDKDGDGNVLDDIAGSFF